MNRDFAEMLNALSTERVEKISPAGRLTHSDRLQQFAANRLSLPLHAIASLLQGLTRRAWVPDGATLSNLPLAGILRNPMNIATKSFRDLASDLVKLFDNRIKSLGHRHTP